MEEVRNSKGEVLRVIYNKKDIIEAIKEGKTLEHCYMDISVRFESDKFLGMTSDIVVDENVKFNCLRFGNNDCILVIQINNLLIHCDKFEINQSYDTIVIDKEEVK